jgi:4-methyl-5(b-hydroxyethyl)-thiazole monophosphate biosynthesis
MPGAEHLRDSEPLIAILKSQKAQSKPVAAICASPAVVFETHGLLEGHKATSHPAFSDKLSNQDAVLERVVADGSMITSRGPGTAFEFALALVKMLYGDKKMHDVAKPMVMHDGWETSI